MITPSDLRPTRKEAAEIKVIRLLVLSYLSIVRKTYEVRSGGYAVCEAAATAALLLVWHLPCRAFPTAECTAVSHR